jgi:transposase
MLAARAGLVPFGAEFATVLYLEGLFRHFENRRQLAAYAGLAPSPWKMDGERELKIIRRAYGKQVTAAAGVGDPQVEAAFAAGSIIV